jgi:hypothetical protein
MLLPRVLKGVAKSLIIIIPFLIFFQMLTSLDQVFPRASALVETYVVVFVVFVVLGELTKGTIYQHILSMGKDFFFIGYTIFALNNGMITQTVRSITFSVNLQVLITMIIFIGILDFAKSLLQVINYMADKAENEVITVPKLGQEIPAA